MHENWKNQTYGIISLYGLVAYLASKYILKEAAKPILRRALLYQNIGKEIKMFNFDSN